jgi:hypothetical protein
VIETYSWMIGPSGSSRGLSLSLWRSSKDVRLDGDISSETRLYGLSKSRITAFEQCPKRLWLSVHQPELEQDTTSAERGFDVGHEVGDVACGLLPNGIMVEATEGLGSALLTTQSLLTGACDYPIFEATLEHDGVLVRIDILEPDGAGTWRMAEVKSSTTAKPYHLGDLATQLWVARNASVQISSAAIRHIDRDFVLKREGEFDGLFADAELLEAAEPIVQARAAVVRAARETLAGAEPAIAQGPHCDTPFSCPFADYCNLPTATGPEWPVTVLPRGGANAWLARGIDDLFDVDPAALTNPVHKRVHQATISGQAVHDVAAARAAIGAWAFPRSWLDFETIGFAVPRWVGTRPYQQVPFQFSAHIEAQDGELVHIEFLSLDGRDPRRACAELLAGRIPETGAVIAYNASFELARIVELATTFPDLQAKLLAIAERIVDLLPVTRATWYHRDQRGSWSIKAVLPTVAPELDYSGLDVSDGFGAQEAYLEAVSETSSDARRADLDRALREYCGRDTEAMMVLARRLITA